jgi:hypothetical protein
VEPERLSGLVSELDAAAEHLADTALELLHEALGDPDPKASHAAREEKVITRARRSVERAASLLRGLDEGMAVDELDGP